MKYTKTKERIIEFIMSRKRNGIYTRHVHGSEYQTRCPECGDSMKDFNTGHLYMSIDVEDDYNIPCICFKCGFKGILTPDILELMGCDDADLKNELKALNTNGKIKRGTDSEYLYLYFERKLPEEHRYWNKIAYVENRLGIHFTKENLKEMKLVTSLYDFLILNNIEQSPFNRDQRLILERDYVGFLSSGNSHILFRDITGTHKLSWIKYPIEEESRRNKVFYGLDATIDIFTEDEITINLSEGIMDVLGITYHLNHHSANTFNIAVCGQNFNAIIKHMIEIGVFGSNVTLNLFVDNDKQFNSHAKINRSVSIVDLHKKYLESYVPLFHNVNIYWNLKSKDFGVQRENIIVDKKKI